MWDLKNNTPYAVEGHFVRDREGAELRAVTIKGTFALSDTGAISLAQPQVPLLPKPTFTGDPANSSLLYDAELLPARQATDVIVLGHAYAPGKQPVHELNVQLSVGSLVKRLCVFGDRVWERGPKGLIASRPQLFTQMPLVYERAFGGGVPTSNDQSGEARNPVGVGFFSTEADALGGKLPNLERPDQRISRWQDRPLPAGFGPIAPSWSPRRERAGTFDEQWREQRMPLPPEDLDLRYYQCAPDDQQLSPFLSGGESVELLNLTPDGCLRFTLPNASLELFTDVGGETRTHAATLQTVRIEPDARRLTLIWYSQLACHHTLYSLLETRVSEGRPKLPPGAPTPENIPVINSRNPNQ